MPPPRADPWLHATLHLDVADALGEHGKPWIGPGLTNITDNHSVGRGVETWWVVAAVRSW